MMMNEIKVECYAGYKGDERPQRFRLGDQLLEVRTVEDQWYGLSSCYFRVQANDGNNYVLRHDYDKDVWTLDAFRRTASE